MDYVLMLDSLGQRYGCLPSQLLAQGDVLDISIMVKSIAWHNEREARSRSGMEMPVNHNYSNDELQAMLERTRNGI
jgi:hypothetical protein